MGYAILRTQKLKSGIAVRRSMKHAFREQDTPNADPGRTPDNTHIGAKSVDEALARFNARLPEKVRKNAAQQQSGDSSNSGSEVKERSAMIPLTNRPGQPFSRETEQLEIKRLKEAEEKVHQMVLEMTKSVKAKEAELAALKKASAAAAASGA